MLLWKKIEYLFIGTRAFSNIILPISFWGSPQMWNGRTQVRLCRFYVHNKICLCHRYVYTNNYYLHTHCVWNRKTQVCLYRCYVYTTLFYIIVMDMPTLILWEICWSIYDNIMGWSKLKVCLWQCYVYNTVWSLNCYIYNNTSFCGCDRIMMTLWAGQN